MSVGKIGPVCGIMQAEGTHCRSSEAAARGSIPRLSQTPLRWAQRSGLHAESALAPEACRTEGGPGGGGRRRGSGGWVARCAIVFDAPCDLLRCLEAVAADPDAAVERVTNRLSPRYDAALTAGYRCAAAAARPPAAALFVDPRDLCGPARPLISNPELARTGAPASAPTVPRNPAADRRRAAAERGRLAAPDFPTAPWARSPALRAALRGRRLAGSAPGERERNSGRGRVRERLAGSAHSPRPTHPPPLPPRAHTPSLPSPLSTIPLCLSVCPSALSACIPV